MKCDRAQAAISERMDGEHLRPGLALEVDSHVDGCPVCTAFSDRAARVRTLVRIAPAEPVPDLVEPIMTAVAQESRAQGGAPQPSPRRIGRTRLRRRTRIDGRHRSLAPAAVALVVGLVVGSVLVGGPWPRDEHPPSALALPRRVLAGAAALSGVQASFTMTERTFVTGTDGVQTPDERTFGLRVWYRAPERFRMQVRDENPETTGSVAPNNVAYIVNRDRSFRRAPSGCPQDLIDVCPEQRTLVTRGTHRPPFSSHTPLPADLLLPVNVFASLDHGVPELGRTHLLGREAIHVELSYAQAAPLFSFLQVGGQWRPFFRQDRVDLWLDADTWFPLRAQISATPSDARRSWERRFSLPQEYGKTPLFRLSATSYRDVAPPNRVFAVPSSGRLHSEDAQRVPIASLRGRLPFAPRALGDAENLRPYRATATSTPAGRQVVVAYAAGLTWLRVTTEPPRTGPLPQEAELVRLGNGGSGYLRPDLDQLGRSLLVHTPGADLVLDTNLPRSELLRIAAVLPVVGQPLPSGANPSTGANP